MSAGVEQREAAAQDGEADARGARGGRGGSGGGFEDVVRRQHEAAVADREGDADSAGQGEVADVLKRVFHQGHQEQRRHGQLRRVDVDRQAERIGVGHAQALQGHQLLQEAHLVRERHLAARGALRQVAHQSREADDGLRGALRGGPDEGVDVVERVIQEVGVELTAQPEVLALRVAEAHLL